jgi:hypothetical protein
MKYFQVHIAREGVPGRVKIKFDNKREAGERFTREAYWLKHCQGAEYEIVLSEVWTDARGHLQWRDLAEETSHISACADHDNGQLA